jgi:aminoglycoside phosphotransferase (APT) family kinase protein
LERRPAEFASVLYDSDELAPPTRRGGDETLLVDEQRLSLARGVEKRDITVDVVSRLVSAQFPQWRELPIRPVDTDGNDNTSFRLGDDLLVRLPSHDRYVAGVEKEHQWLPFLGSRLPRPIPEPVAYGTADPPMFPRPWSIYRWIDGETAGTRPPADLVAFAVDVAEFLGALYTVDITDGPAAGEQNFWRGGPLTRYDRQTRKAITDLDSSIDGGAALDVWDTALASQFAGPPVWVHGDVVANNLLVRDGRLHAVIDFGTSAIGDPACDTVLAWTFLDGASRRAFRDRLPLDDDTWVRGRGWALWKAVITLAWNPDNIPAFTKECRRVLETIISEHHAEAPHNNRR